MKPLLFKVFVTSAAFGALFGAYFLYVGIAHDSQGEFVTESGQFDILYCIEIFGAWFVVGSILGVVACFAVNMVIKLFRRSN